MTLVEDKIETSLFPDCSIVILLHLDKFEVHFVCANRGGCVYRYLCSNGVYMHYIFFLIHRLSVAISSTSLPTRHSAIVQLTWIYSLPWPLPLPMYIL